VLGPGSGLEPSLDELFDLRIRDLGMITARTSADELDRGIAEVAGDTELVGQRELI
jgi:hypothetical protein